VPFPPLKRLAVKQRPEALIARARGTGLLGWAGTGLVRLLRAPRQGDHQERRKDRDENSVLIHHPLWQLRVAVGMLRRLRERYRKYFGFRSPLKGG
jgi:hypothetical protein